ncbi:MAG: PLP-dependent aminotransferase family protein [Sphingobacteriales bacterium]|nr:MAG: PLP-dependent aminotransferase family protein [Sphingobacteriales bacterium]
MLRPWKLELQLDAENGKAIYLQIADAIIADIQSGRLKSGTALPGSRILARDLNLNRNTIVEALNVLLHEEWLVSKERKGTFVADILPVLTQASPGAGLEAVSEKYQPALRINFDDGSPDSKVAPVAALARAYRQIFNLKARWQMMAYGDERGDKAFRNAIVQMLNHQRGMQLNEQELFITRGSQMAMYLTAHCMFSKGDYVLVEAPGYQPAWQAFEHAGAQLLPVMVDQDGLIIEEVRKWLQQHPDIKAIYTTPHHQYPTTVTLSLQRRLELIRLSNEYGFTIIEDDYDNEFHFGYRPVLPLSSYPELQHYVYIGTMSKVVAPALRIGYLASKDPELLKRIAAHRRIIDVQGDAIMEQAVLQLIQDGTIKRHLRKATQYYKLKRDVVTALLNKYLASKASFAIPEGGLAFWLVPKHQVDWQLVQEQLHKKGIRILHPEAYSFGQTENGLRLGYAYLSEAKLEEGLSALGKCL